MIVEREERFRAIYAEHYDAVLRFARRRTDPDRAEDVVAEAFLVAWRRLDQVPSRPGEALPWLYAVTRHCLMSAARAAGRQAGLAVRIADHPPPGDPDPSAAADQRLDLAAAWRHLSPDDQEVLALALFEDLPSVQASRVIGTSPSAYRLRLSRARRRLRALLAAEPAQRAARLNFQEQS